MEDSAFNIFEETLDTICQNSIRLMFDNKSLNARRATMAWGANFVWEGAIAMSVNNKSRACAIRCGEEEMTYITKT